VAEKIEAVIFDMGGVILRSENYASRNRLANTYGISECKLEDLVFESETAMRATVGAISQEEHWQAVFNTLSVPPDKQAAFQEDYWAGDRLDQTLLDFLESLRPEYKTGLLSNAWTGSREMLFGKYACKNVFDISIFSYEVGLAKPGREIFELILTRLGVRASAALFIDDNHQNIAAARQLGFHALLFENQDQALRDMRALV